MEIDLLDKKIASFAEALKTLNDIIQHGIQSTIERDALIHRFEYTFEMFWKSAKIYLWKTHGLDYRSPKKVIRGLFQVDLLSENEISQALEMVDDRNLSVHTYNENFADEMSDKIPGYYNIMKRYLNTINR